MTEEKRMKPQKEDDEKDKKVIWLAQKRSFNDSVAW